MELELYKIKRSMHHDVITSFWTMLQELAGRAHSDNDPVLKHQAEGWYRQWNRMTGDDKKPVWATGENHANPSLLDGRRGVAASSRVEELRAG